MAVRSGRFSFDNHTTAGNYTFVEVASNKGDAAIYRLFNSGEVEFTLDVGNGARKLAPNNSIDVAVGRKASLGVAWLAPASAKNIRLSYDFLADEDGSALPSAGPPRSGRFVGVPATDGPVIVDLGNDGGAAYYRVLNAGETGVTLEAGGHGMGSSPSTITIPPKFSKDVLVTNGNPGDKVLKLTNTGKVDVIYDLLGGVE